MASKAMVRADTGTGSGVQPAPAQAARVKGGGTGTAASALGKQGGNVSKVTYIGNGGAKTTGTAASPKVTPGTTPDWFKEQEKLFERMNDEQVRANNAAAEAAGKNARETRDAAVDALSEQYRGVNRQLYRDYMNAARVLPQQLAAQGYSGGLTESSRLRLGNSYEEGLNENERSRLSQVAAADRDLAQRLYEIEAGKNQANAQAKQNLYSRQASLNESKYANLQQRASAMAAAGDFTEYAGLGFSDSEIRYLREMWRRMNPKLA